MFPDKVLEATFLTVVFVHVTLSECGVPLAWDGAGTPESLTDLVKNYVEPRNSIQSRNSFEQSANPVTKWAPEGLNKPQSGQFGSVEQNLNSVFFCN